MKRSKTLAVLLLKLISKDWTPPSEIANQFLSEYLKEAVINVFCGFFPALAIIIGLKWLSRDEMAACFIRSCWLCGLPLYTSVKASWKQTSQRHSIDSTRRLRGWQISKNGGPHGAVVFFGNPVGVLHLGVVSPRNQQQNAGENWCLGDDLLASFFGGAKRLAFAVGFREW